MRRSLAAIALTTAIVLSGCGGGEAEITDADSLAAAIGCEAEEPTQAAPGTEDAATCMLDGDELALATFTDEDARDSWLALLDMAGSLTDFESAVAMGETWAVVGQDAAVIEKAAEDAGGEVR